MMFGTRRASPDRRVALQGESRFCVRHFQYSFGSSDYAEQKFAAYLENWIMRNPQKAFSELSEAQRCKKHKWHRSAIDTTYQHPESRQQDELRFGNADAIPHDLACSVSSVHFATRTAPARMLLQIAERDLSPREKATQQGTVKQAIDYYRRRLGGGDKESRELRQATQQAAAAGIAAASAEAVACIPTKTIRDALEHCGAPAEVSGPACAVANIAVRVAVRAVAGRASAWAADCLVADTTPSEQIQREREVLAKLELFEKVLRGGPQGHRALGELRDLERQERGCATAAPDAVAEDVYEDAVDVADAAMVVCDAGAGGPPAVRGGAYRVGASHAVMPQNASMALLRHAGLLKTSQRMLKPNDMSVRPSHTAAVLCLGRAGAFDTVQ